MMKNETTINLKITKSSKFNVYFGLLFVIFVAIQIMQRLSFKKISLNLYSSSCILLYYCYTHLEFKLIIDVKNEYKNKQKKRIRYG